MKISQEFQDLLISILKENQAEFDRLLPQVDLTQDDEGGISALHYAAETGNLPALEAILATRKIDVNKATLQSGSTALMQAAMRGHLAAVETLLDAGADARITSRTGYSALMMAVEAGSLDCTKTLLRFQIDLNTLNSNGQNICNLAVKSPEILALILQTGQVHKSCPEASPLHSAALAVESARLLLDYGFDVNFMDHSGDTPLGTAIKHQNLQVAEFLIENGADLMLVSKHRESTFELAALYDDSEEFLRKHQCPAQFLSLVIVGCAAKNRLDLLKSLAGTERIEAAASGDAFVAASQNGALASVLFFLPFVIEEVEALFTGAQSAIASGFMTVFEEIFAFVSKNASNQVLQSLHQSLSYLLLTAAENDKVEAVNFLLKQGVPVDGDGSEGCTPLIAAAASGSVEVVRALLGGGAEVDAEHEHGGTALLLAATNGHLEIVKELLLHGADQSIKDSSGFTPLLAATLYNHIEIVNVLLSKPLQVNSSSNEGFSPLLAAASIGDDAVADKFLNLGAELKQCDDQGNTALHLAAQKRHVKTISFLIRKGFGVDAFCCIKNTENYTPLQILINDSQANTISQLLEEFSEMKLKIQAPTMQAVEPDHLCLICRDEMEAEALVLPCKHEFHFHCFDEWSNLHPKCPTCKRFPYKSI